MRAIILKTKKGTYVQKKKRTCWTSTSLYLYYYLPWAMGRPYYNPTEYTFYLPKHFLDQHPLCSLSIHPSILFHQYIIYHNLHYTSHPQNATKICTASVPVHRYIVLSVKTLRCPWSSAIRWTLIGRPLGKSTKG